jgi:hypothetical protein
MSSLLQGIKNAHFGDVPHKSVAQIALIFGKSRPISVRRLVQLLKPEQLTWKTGWVGSDQFNSPADSIVQGQLTVVLSSTGFSTLDGEVKDNGHGADFSFSIWSRTFTADAPLPHIWGESESLSKNQDYSFHKPGRDFWISRNWDQIRSHGFQWAIHAHWMGLEWPWKTKVDLGGHGVGVNGRPSILLRIDRPATVFIDGASFSLTGPNGQMFTAAATSVGQTNVELPEGYVPFGAWNVSCTVNFHSDSKAQTLSTPTQRNWIPDFGVTAIFAFVLELEPGTEDHYTLGAE